MRSAQTTRLKSTSAGAPIGYQARRIGYFDVGGLA